MLDTLDIVGKPSMNKGVHQGGFVMFRLMMHLKLLNIEQLCH
jgi:hypothetical protein